MEDDILEELLRDILDLRENFERHLDSLKEELLREIVLLKWLIGGLAFFGACIGGLVIRMGLQMFNWKLEIDKGIHSKGTDIAVLNEWIEGHEKEAKGILEELKIQREKIMELRRKNGWP